MFSEPGIIYGMLCCWLFLSFSVRVEAQHIPLRNPSLEGPAGKGILPDPWYVAAGTPDTQPGVFGIKLLPSAGKSYVGLHSGKGFLEGIGQELPLAMSAHMDYVLSFDLAYTSYYLYPACYGNLAIYGGNAPGDTAELLWSSGNFTHESWERYDAVLRPSGAYRYLSFIAYPTTPCNKSQYGIALLIDNLSALDRLELPVVTAVAQPCSCGEVTDGSITAHVTGGVSPFQYRLDNGRWQADSVFTALAAGQHFVEIQDSHRFTARVMAKVESPWKNCLVVMPTAFSPNNDGQNDVFRPKVYDAIHDYRLRVYDRWGQLIFSGAVPENGWDGTFKGSPAAVQAYVYICTYTDSRQQSHVLKGTVMLLR
ncbi:MAG: gliding motility-associated C-terminal domain-containing protein [Chitinophaga sp.]|uniref:T9SS type B sorting domain-containing protein n=1 Tax=Chitinophaga sp. TaxID=1869181 RepID=UPI001B068DE0|nr:gliding motility-associated C-terminal domain-containing protein [Chitinophaga sp.]MBO9732372.1 gliding motility-associated C-terminal domain-containing protein [Chitinophaga sp.]